ncbi:MAG: transporter substrate-binding domain-containing protein [Pseudomonas sp.]|uniref:substrate-binding periplasmic protein n=1 Tax=Pseudomonas sp. TaxID=306 RepID=UPI0033963082
MRLALLLICALLGPSAGATNLLVAMEDANNTPFEYIDENARLTGFHVELLRAVTERLGWTLTFKRYPWKRTMKALAAGEVQAASFVAKNAEREQFAVFLPDNLLHVSRTTLYIKRERAADIHYRPPLDQMARRWRTALPNGYYMSDQVVELVRQGVPIEQPTVTQSQLFIMLISGRFDAIFGSTSALSRASAEIADLDQQVQRLEGARFSGKPMYLAFSTTAPPSLAKEFAEAYRQFRLEPAYRLLAQRFGMLELLPEPGEFQ